MTHPGKTLWTQVWMISPMTDGVRRDVLTKHQYILVIIVIPYLYSRMGTQEETNQPNKIQTPDSPKKGTPSTRTEPAQTHEDFFARCFVSPPSFVTLKTCTRTRAVFVLLLVPTNRHRKG